MISRTHTVHDVLMVFSEEQISILNYCLNVLKIPLVTSNNCFTPTLATQVSIFICEMYYFAQMLYRDKYFQLMGLIFLAFSNNILMLQKHPPIFCPLTTNPTTPILSYDKYDYPQGLQSKVDFGSDILVQFRISPYK